MPVRVLVVDDSSFFRRQISKLLAEDPGLEVIDSAENGEEAVAKTLELKPDVVTMDIEMPVMDGINATREIMRKHPVPILMFSSLTTNGAKATLDALEAGAVDFIPKRFEDISKKREEVKKILCEKVIQIGKHGLNALRRKNPTPRPKLTTVSSRPSSKIGSIASSNYKLIAIGCSTGGPVALQEILANLPESFPLPIIMVQHMPASFTAAFAERLNQQCAIGVKEAENGDVLKAGHAYLAPGGKQMEVRSRGTQLVIEVRESEPDMTYKPSVDVTFTSLAKSLGNQVLASILTGMGADGCEGCKKLKKAGSTIWAQNEESCVVYGMPAAVYEAGITDKMLALTDFSSHIVKSV